MAHTIRGHCPTCGHAHDTGGFFIAPVGTLPDQPGWQRVAPIARIPHPSTTPCRVHGIRRCTICFAPCQCECNSGGFCGGCGHAGCGGRA